MKYMVMECHPGYAVVMDDTGRFLKVANMHYEVGQTVTSVVEMKKTDTRSPKLLKKRITAAASLAACLCLMLLGSWKFLLTPYGSVRMQINPDVQITVNSLDYVIDLEGLNEDGENLIEGYRYQWKKVDTVSDGLADRAIEMGYLKEGGNIRLTVESEHETWQKETEDRIILELEVHVGDSITVTHGEKNQQNLQDGIIIPVDPIPSRDTDDDADDQENEPRHIDDDDDLDDDDVLDDGKDDDNDDDGDDSDDNDDRNDSDDDDDRNDSDDSDDKDEDSDDQDDDDED